jgi:hypothetical protein
MSKLYILWTNADEVTFDKMVAMYARNAKIERWWDEVTVIVWGSTARLAAESPVARQRIAELLQVGVLVSACKACSDSLGTTDRLEAMGVAVEYWGEGLTRILKDGEKLLTV